MQIFLTKRAAAPPPSTSASATIECMTVPYSGPSSVVSMNANALLPVLPPCAAATDAASGLDGRGAGNAPASERRRKNHNINADCL